MPHEWRWSHGAPAQAQDRVSSLSRHTMSEGWGAEN